MRRSVPFIGEERMERADDEQANAKKARGRVIDEIVSSSADHSSWEDVVAPSYWPSRPEPKKRSRPGISVPKSTPAKAKPHFAPAAKYTQPNSIKKTIRSAYMGGSIDWVPINNGHALRINISGNLDQNLRDEWRRLLDETANSSVGQFEFNMTQAPALTLTGLGMLLLFKEQKRSERGDIKLSHCNKDVWKMLQWTGMDQYFTIQKIPGVE
jgi:anti-anti-sigma factor